MCRHCCFFFFQAEDGIRDLTVTGVQTCALPISASPAAYSPRTHLFYTSTNNLCMDYAAWRASHLKGTPFVGVDSPYLAGPGGNLGSFIAWDAATGRKVWENKEAYPTWSGALVTAGDVAFYGTLDGWFKSIDAKTGKVLRSEEHTSELQSQSNLVCRLLLEKKTNNEPYVPSS